MNYELSKEEIRDMLCENKVWDAIEELKDGFIEEHEGDNEARRRLGQEEEELDEDEMREYIEAGGALSSEMNHQEIDQWFENWHASETQNV
tara:strand:- start:385 stop:657 length:273 start_codon:yes stop_codon:yes gene_type:complete